MNKYEQFIQDIISKRGQWNPPTTYWEGHHIIPKCRGGLGRADQKHDNIIRLTAAEHFEAHKLLVECYPDDEKLAYAFWAMCTISEASSFCTAEEYEQARIHRSETIGKQIQSKLIGTTAGESTKFKHAAAQAGQNNGFYGKNHSAESKLKLSSSQSKKVRCINTGEIYSSSYEAERLLGISRVLINNCCRGKQESTSGGMKFEYVNKDDINYNLPGNKLTKYERRRIIIELRKIVVSLNNKHSDVLSAEDTKRISKLATCENRRYLLGLINIFEERGYLDDELRKIIADL